MEDPKRMWIDLRPPDRPEIGDTWCRRGELRVWREDGWNPPWQPPPDMPPGYPKPGRRKRNSG